MPTQVQAVQSHVCLDAADCICQKVIQSLATSTLEGTRQQLTLCTAVVAMHQHTITVHSQTTARSKSMELRQVRLFLFTPADHSTGLLDVQHGILATCVALEQVRTSSFHLVQRSQQHQYCSTRQLTAARSLLALRSVSDDALKEAAASPLLCSSFRF